MDRADRPRARFLSVLGGSSTPSLLVMAGGIAAVNDAAVELFGYSAALMAEVGLTGLGLGDDPWQHRFDEIFSGTLPSSTWRVRLSTTSGPLEADVTLTGIRREGVEPVEMVAVVQIAPVAADRDPGVELARQRYERLVDAAQEGVWEIDADAVTVFANPRMAELLGTTVSDLIGRSLFDFLDEDVVEQAQANLRARAAGTRGRFDIRYRRSDGGVVWAMVSSVGLFDGEGRFRGASATVVDITERRRQEAELRAAEERFRRTFDGAPIGMAIVGLDGRWLQVNESLCRLLGRPATELVTCTFSELTHPDDVEESERLYAETLAGERTGYSIDKRYVHADGSEIWASLTVALLRDEDGEPLYCVSQIKDIRARKQLEVELTSARRQLERIVTHAAIPMAVVSADGTLTEVNDRFRGLFGRLPSELGRSLVSLVDDSSQVALATALAPVVAGNRDHASVECEVPRGDGASGHVRFELAALPGEGAASAIVQAVDVTDERRARVELERLATHDALTGVLNRRGFDRALDELRIVPNPGLAVVYADLDAFKEINDALGHVAGDRTLVSAARAMAEVVRGDDLIARLGGDEFAVLVRSAGDREVEEVADRIREAVESLPVVEANGVSVTVGWAVWDDLREDPADVVRRADDAMLAAKARRRLSGALP